MNVKFITLNILDLLKYNEYISKMKAFSLKYLKYKILKISENIMIFRLIAKNNHSIHSSIS